MSAFLNIESRMIDTRKIDDLTPRGQSVIAPNAANDGIIDAMPADVAIRVSNLSKCYHVYDRPQDRLKQFLYPRLQKAIRRKPRDYCREFWALRNVSFEIKRGETFGVIGRNGSGKSTLLQLVCGTLNPSAGSVQVNGRVAALLELGAGFNPEFSGRENVYMNGAVLGLSQEEIDARFDQIASFADIGEFIEQPVKTYSSGMFVRLAFAVQAHIDASVVIIDEALAVGDVFFRQKCYARLEQLKHSGAAIVLVSHSMPEIEQFCERALLLDHGSPRFLGSAPAASKHYYLLNQTVTGIAATPTRNDTGEVTEVRHHQVGDRPSTAAFLDLSGKSQITDGRARCVGIAVCNANEEPCNVFRQGDKAIFFYEFEVYADLGVPICGVVIKDEKGAIVHGKNGWQFEGEIPESLGSGTKVTCRQEIELRLGLGEYSFEIGLASVSKLTWENRKSISHDEWAIRHSTVCVVTDAGRFSVGLACRENIFILTHHGLADLPGNALTRVG